MATYQQFTERFAELAKQCENFPRDPEFHDNLSAGPWSKWRISALHLLELTFGTTSASYAALARIEQSMPRNSAAIAGISAFLAAKEDFDKGFSKSIEQSVSGEILGDFVTLAKSALADGQKNVAAVLACAALEDALKRYASINGLKVDGKTMDNVVGALKSAGLVQGAQKSLLDAMPRVRNCAMHADWAKITEPDVNSVIGFVESFLQTKF